MPRGLKFFLSSLLIGALSIGAAWAGAILMPQNPTGVTADAAAGQGWLASVESGSEGEGEQLTAQGLEALQANQVYAGAHKVNIAPNPEKYNGIWEKNAAHCETLTAPQEIEPGQATDFRVRWAENSNCIYAGGFDIGPANAVSQFDEEFGLYARATAVSDGNDTVVLMLLDGAYYFAKYGQMCNDDSAHPSDFDGEGPGANTYTQDCGFRDLQTSMAQKYGFMPATPGATPLDEETEGTRGDLGIEPASFFLASSHAHASPDFVGAWGGVPRWYMQQVEDAIREAVYGAIDSMQPAYVEAGEVLYRGGNSNRRDHYHAAEEATETWMRFVAEEDSDPVCTTPEVTESVTASAAPEDGEEGKGKGKDKKPKPTPSPSESPDPSPTPEPSDTPTPEPTCTQPPPNKRSVATIGTYAAHPVDSLGEARKAYADLSGVFATRAEERFGGTGLYFQTGFGNMSSSGSRRGVAEQLVSFIPDLGLGTQVMGPVVDQETGARGPVDIKSVMRTFDQPATNVVLSGGGATGVFDRPFESKPSAVSIGKGSLSADTSRMPYKRCNSASGLTVNSSVSVAKIGNLLITGGPGELFSNYTNTIKERYQAGTVFPLSLVNDGLGYIMQSIETDHVGRQAVGFANGPLSEYEDAYSIDACFGDHALEQTLAAIGSI